jgi:hypothetical protein
MNQTLDERLSIVAKKIDIIQNSIKQDQNKMEFLQQNIFLLSELKKYDINSKMYNLRMIQLETNIQSEKRNEMAGEIIFGPQIIE